MQLALIGIGLTSVVDIATPTAPFHPTNSETCKFYKRHMHTILPYILIKRIAMNRVKSELLAASFSD